jgi:ubiquinone biosynthesis protein COQ4
MTKSTAQLAPYRNPGGVVPERINWRELLSCWRTLFEPGKDLDRLYETLVAVQAPAGARTYHRVRAHPNGRKIFESKPDILALLEDDDYLASLPVGSVGHAFRSFLTTNRLDAGVYSEAVIRPIAEKNNWSEGYYYSVVRNTALHDVLHTITGYGPDAAGEALALGFFCGQTEPAGPIRLAGLTLTLITPGASLRHKLRCYQEATERGRRADNIFAAPWEELLEKPLDEVRKLLGVTSKAAAHPNGTWYTDWMPIGMNTPAAWDYDEALKQTT